MIEFLILILFKNKLDLSNLGVNILRGSEL